MDFDIVPHEDIVWGDRIGGGSFGSVYKGQYLGIDIACKEIHMSTQYDVHKYFEREWRIMRECRHPNIVLFLGLSSEPDGDGRVFIVSEFLPRGNLRSFIRSHTPFPWRLRISFATDVARAVAYLHARQCLHRDLKGENLLITSNNRLKVADFGFARITGRNAEEMKHMTYCGTDGYMSPEIIMGEQFDLPTDVYSLGIIFIEILTRILVGSKVYSRQAPTFIPDGDIVRRRASPGCPPAFIDLALECCAFAPEDRPKMPEVLTRLRVIEKGIPEAEEAPHVGSLKVVKREGKRAMPDFEQRSLDSELAAAVVEAQVGGFDDDESIESIAHAEVIVDGNGPAKTPCKKSIPWDELTSEYLNASEMRTGLEPLLTTAPTSPSPPSPTSMESTQILKSAGSPRVPMPCAYPPSPPYDDDAGSTYTVRGSGMRVTPPTPPPITTAVAAPSLPSPTSPWPLTSPTLSPLFSPVDTPNPLSREPSPANLNESKSKESKESKGSKESKSSKGSNKRISIGSHAAKSSTSDESSKSNGSGSGSGSSAKSTHRFTLIHREQPALLSMAASIALAFFPRPGIAKDTSKCSVCTKRMGSRMALQCDDCGILVHPRCSSTAPRNCLADIGVDP